MSKRVIIFLTLIIPIYYLICFAILAVIALLFPPDIITQLVVFTPIYLVATASITSYVVRHHVIPPEHQPAGLHRRVLLGTGAIHFCVIALLVGLILSGLTTPLEGFVICATLILIALAILIRRHWTRPA